jgi:preprotein translocase subunit SecA
MNLSSLLVFSTSAYFRRQEKKRLVRYAGVAKQAIASASPPKLNGLPQPAELADLRVTLKRDPASPKVLAQGLALASRAAYSSLGLAPYEVQLMGACALVNGDFIEMSTGEGKTLVGFLASSQAALADKKVHVVTANDYLAARDADSLRPAYTAMGLTVAAIRNGMSPLEKKTAYACDVVYGTHQEFGFDYLRDQVASSLDYRVQAGLDFALIDEADSILIDEARTPLILSGQIPIDTKLVSSLATLVAQLTEDEDYSVQRKNHVSTFTETGYRKVEDTLVHYKLLPAQGDLYKPEFSRILRDVHAALDAKALYVKDKDYVVLDDKILIVDSQTGRLSSDRRWQNGLHQAIEAKEGVTVQVETGSMAEVSYQNYFKLYKTLSGMSGTLLSEREEIEWCYGRQVVSIPPNRPNIRKDLPDRLFLSDADKVKAVIAEVKHAQARAQPVLVGTSSVENSAKYSDALTAAGIPHRLLNARTLQEEAEIIAQAGLPGAVTVATNMAGRGTDILLGGAKPATADADQDKPVCASEPEAYLTNLEAAYAAGGLYVLGTERNLLRRADAQLMGRAGRQGAPGQSVFFTSLDDELVKHFAAPPLVEGLRALAGDEPEGIANPLVSKLIRKAQKKLEQQLYDERRTMLGLDNVMAEQRKVIYQFRDSLLGKHLPASEVRNWVSASATWLASQFLPGNASQLKQLLNDEMRLQVPIMTWLADEPEGEFANTAAMLTKAMLDRFDENANEAGEASFTEFLNHVGLEVLDLRWLEQMGAMDSLRAGIHLRAFSGKNPDFQFRIEAFQMFEETVRAFEFELARIALTVSIKPAEPQPEPALDPEAVTA